LLVAADELSYRACYNPWVKGQESESLILLEKIREQVTLVQDLISLIPVSRLEWRPQILPQSARNEAHRDAEDPATNSSETLGAVVPAASRGMSSASELLRMGDLLGHLLECMAGFCALLYSMNSRQLAHFVELRRLPVNRFCEVDEARTRIGEYMSHIEEGFALLNDADLVKLLPTVFAPEGEPILTLLLGNLEHLINHKYQLFIYLRLLGVHVGTRELYRFRGGEPESESRAENELST